MQPIQQKFTIGPSTSVLMTIMCGAYLGSLLASIQPVRSAVVRVLDHGESLTAQIETLLPMVALILLAEGLTSALECRIGFGLGGRAPRIPLIFIPFGRTIRWAVMEVVSSLVILPKLLIYLLSILVIDSLTLLFRPLERLRERRLPRPVVLVTAGVVYLSAPLSCALIVLLVSGGELGTHASSVLLVAAGFSVLAHLLLAFFVDDFDDMAAHVETRLVRLYNASYGLPLGPGEDGLGVWFNRYTWLWCVNH